MLMFRHAFDTSDVLFLTYISVVYKLISFESFQLSFHLYSVASYSNEKSFKMGGLKLQGTFIIKNLKP